MTVHHFTPGARKSLAESALCFGSALAGLSAAAVALQWLLGLIG